MSIKAMCVIATITYVLNGGINSILNPDEISRETQLPIVLAAPYRQGYNFSGWFSDEKYKNQVEMIETAEDMTLYAKWTLSIDAAVNVENYPYQIRTDADSRRLKDCNYSFLHTIETPGNPRTRMQDFEEHLFDSLYQCPQGLCVAEDYLIITSYCTGKEKALGAIIFYDRRTGKHVKTFGMNRESHLGGITFDGENLWICHSDSRQLERISFAFLQHLIGVSHQNFIDISDCFRRYDLENVPSCISFANDRLYVATHRIYRQSVMYAYEFDRKADRLCAVKKYYIPAKVQGVAMDDEGRVYFSASYGRQKSSYLYVYPSLRSLETLFSKPVFTVEMPPGSEELIFLGDEVFVLFETACYKYHEGADGKGVCAYPIDKILRLDVSSLFYD